jgi:hypothetical protein
MKEAWRQAFVEGGREGRREGGREGRGKRLS